jgi:hypothetical protein
VRTTLKTGKPSRKDLKPEPRAIVVAAMPDEARWALQPSPVSKAKRAATAPSFSHKGATAAPSEVITVGFQRGAPTADASRFSGSAVTFMPVARFATN